MNTFTTGRDVFAQSVSFQEHSMVVQLDDGRAISIPITWYPRLLNASPEERANYELIAGGEGIHWPALDEDISVQGLLAGRPSAETSASLAKWLQTRNQPSPSDNP